jgi:hypothetical protein
MLDIVHQKKMLWLLQMVLAITKLFPEGPIHNLATNIVLNDVHPFLNHYLFHKVKCQQAIVLTYEVLEAETMKYTVSLGIADLGIADV